MPTYIKLDDTCPDHPSIVGLSDAAFACWVRCLCYSSRHLTDGFIPTSAARTLGPSKALKELVAGARLEIVDGGWRVHGYEERQRTRAQVEADRAKWRARQDRHRGVTTPSRRDTPGSHEGVTRPEVEVEVEEEQQQAAGEPADRPTIRQARLAAAAGIIGDRAAQRPGVRDPAATKAAVARGIERDRHQEGYAFLSAHPLATPADLAEHLEPTGRLIAGPGLVLPPTSAPEEIADFAHRAPPRMDDDARATALATIHDLKRPPEPAA